MEDLPATLPALSDAEVQALGGAGFFVRESVVSIALALQARVEAEAFRLSGRLQPAGVSREGRIDPDVRGDLKTWITEEARSPGFVALRDSLVALGQAVSEAAYLGLVRHDVQLAYYEGGAKYVRHRDAFAGSNESRRLTAITYLNPGWQLAHGGALRVYPVEGAAPVDVAPRLGTTVVFLAERVEHEVLPSFAPRYAVTAWFYAR